MSWLWVNSLKYKSIASIIGGFLLGLKLAKTVLAKRRTLSVSLLVLSIFFTALQTPTFFEVLGIARAAFLGDSNMPNVNRSIEGFGDIGNITVSKPTTYEPVVFNESLLPIISTPVVFNESLSGDYERISVIEHGISGWSHLC